MICVFRTAANPMDLLPLYSSLLKDEVPWHCHFSAAAIVVAAPAAVELADLAFWQSLPYVVLEKVVPSSARLEVK